MTRRNQFTPRIRTPLTGLESEVMQAVWEKQPCTVDAVYELVGRNRNLKETSVRTILRRLEQKGYLIHESDGRAYVYSAVEKPRSLAARAVRQIIDRFCEGSVEELVSGMVDAKVLSKSEMKTLEDFVRSQREKGK